MANKSSCQRLAVFCPSRDVRKRPNTAVDTGRSGPKAEFICYDTNDELACEVGCKSMITTVSQDDYLSYFVVVHCIDIETYERLAVHFECRRDGMRVTDGNRYISIPVTMAISGGTLAWVKNELGGR